MEAAAGHQFETYTYVDMDHDGAAEMIGTYCGDRSGTPPGIAAAMEVFVNWSTKMMIGWTAVSLNCWTWGRKPMWF